MWPSVPLTVQLLRHDAQRSLLHLQDIADPVLLQRRAQAADDHVQHLLFGTRVLLLAPEDMEGLRPGYPDPPPVHQAGQKFLGFGAGEADFVSLHDQVKVAEGPDLNAGSGRSCPSLGSPLRRIVQLLGQALPGQRFQNVARRMHGPGVRRILRMRCQKQDVRLPLLLPYASTAAICGI